MTIKVYPSSSSFFKGYAVRTVKNSSCLRYIGATYHSGLTREQLHTEIAAEYQALGTLDETRYAIYMDKNKIKYEREVPFKVEFKGITISGRMDFLLEDGTIVEKKSTTSQSVYKRVFESGVPEIAHMAQLVSYMAFRSSERGLLVHTYYELGPQLDSYVVVAEKEFVVTIDSGRVMLGQEEYPHTVKDLAKWYSEAEKILANPAVDQRVPPKPLESASYRESPCNFCPLKNLCAGDVSGMTLAEFSEQAVSALLEKRPGSSFKILINTERRQVNRENKANPKVSPKTTDKKQNTPQGDNHGT